jgi:glucose-6-phosphate isomerase
MITNFDPGLAITPTTSPLGFSYGADCFGPEVDYRHLDNIRRSLLDPNCQGPDPVYAIAMNVGRIEDLPKLLRRNLLFGVVTYAAGRLGAEPVRSQGHVHMSSPRHGWSTPEVYEIWQGRAVILMQESDTDDPGRCFAVEASPGQVVIVPPGWTHATISASAHEPLTFGAWCDRDYGFIYDGVREHGGMAWFPLLDEPEGLRWQRNPTYECRELMIKQPESYRELGLEPDIPIYEQFARDPDRFGFVSEPQRARSCWRAFIP